MVERQLELSITQDEFDRVFKPHIDALKDWQLRDFLILSENLIARRLRPARERNKKKRSEDEEFKARMKRASKRNPSRPVKQVKLSYQEYLKSDEWAELRLQILERDSNQCVACGFSARDVHHRSYDKHTMSGERLFKLVSLCSDCHHAIHFDGETRRKMVDVDEMLIQLIQRNARVSVLNERVRKDMGLKLVPVVA